MSVHINYPDSVIKNLPKIEGRLISCLAQDISLFQELPDDLTSENFYSEEAKIFFNIMKVLYNKKYAIIDEISINSEFPIGTEIRANFELYDGLNTIKSFKNGMLSIENFDKYKNDFISSRARINLYKEIVLAEARFHDEDFANESPEAIYHFIDHNISSAIMGVLDSEDIFNLEIDDEFIQKCKNGEAVGTSYGLKEMCKQTLGIHLGNLSIFSAPTNTGKTSCVFSAFVMKLAEMKEKIFIYSNETDKIDFQTSLLVYILVKKFKIFSITKTKLKTGKLTEEEWGHVDICKEYIRNEITPYITIKYPKSHSMKDFISYVRRYAYRGYQYFWIDTMKSDSAGDEHAVGLLVDQSRMIYEVAKKLKVHVTASYQIASYHIEKFVRILTEGHLAGAKQVSEVADIVWTMRDIYNDEWAGEKNEIKVFRINTNDDGATWQKEWVELNRDKKYVLMNIPKNRYGQRGVLMIYEKQGYYGLFSEVGFAIVKGD